MNAAKAGSAKAGTRRQIDGNLPEASARQTAAAQAGVRRTGMIGPNGPAEPSATAGSARSSETNGSGAGHNRRRSGSGTTGSGLRFPGSMVQSAANHPAAWLAIVALIAAIAVFTGDMVLPGPAHYPLVGIFSLLFFGAAGVVHFQSRKIRLNAQEIVRLQRALEEQADRAWELRESEERYRAMAQAFGDMIVHRDRAGNILFCNIAFATLFGQTVEKVVGRQMSEVLPCIPAPGTHDSQGLAQEVRIGKGRNARWLQWIDMPIRDSASGAPVVRTIARDITDHKRAEQALEAARRKAESANSAKSHFLGMVSHEMRTPLNGLLGLSTLMRETQLTPEQRTYVDAMHSSGEALLGLIEDLLDLTVIEAGRLDIKEVETRPDRLVEEVCELLAHKARGKNIEIAAKLDANVPATIVTDDGRLRQVLINLIGNAVKFTERGGVEAAVCAEAESGQTRLVFTIADTGPGMREDELQRIFEEFEQGDCATTRRHGGAGLGLSISQRIVHAMGGSITVSSRPGKGATFRFSLPVVVKDPARETLKNAMGGQRILVISPGAKEGHAIAHHIRQAGGEAQLAPTLTAAAQILRTSRSPFHTVVFDPEVSRDATVSLKRLRSRIGHPLYAVVLVHPGERDARQSYLANGFDGFLVRPVRRASLLRILGERRALASEYRRADGISTLFPDARLETELRILLVEDNEINSLLARSILNKAGQHCVHVHDGREAVNLCKRNLSQGEYFDLILMDLHMPNMDGTTAIRAIRKLEARATANPARIYAVSADEQSSAREDSANSGADGFVAKPFDPAALVALVRRIATERAKTGKARL